MNLDIPAILKAIGPAASIIFAAWIFMGFLQQRYDAAVERYRFMIGQYRAGELSTWRRGNIKDEILVYKRRCELMNTASMIGMVSAILLILTLIIGETAIILPKVSILKYLTAGSAMAGFSLVVVAAIIVILESSIVRRQLDSELLDVRDLAESTGQQPGSIADRPDARRHTG
ncbi:MAG TPA: DUF2721 domain-containing protein [Rhodopila sp.]|nr:DUF2721 domain-containing protein [Rhodopila sp.]